jgi:hypothetical protein
MQRFLCAAMLVLSTSCQDDGAGSVDNDTYVRSASTVVTTEAALEVADDLLGFDPVLDRTHTADQNAMAIEAHAMGALTGCGTVTRTLAMLTVDFGTGCTTPSGHVVSGSIGIGVVARGAEAGATLTFTSFTIDGAGLSGTLGVTTTSTALQIDVALTSGSDSIAGTATIGATTGSFTLDATLTTTRATTTTNLAVAGLVWNRGDCYPSGGTVTSTTGRLVQSITFTAATAMSGTVTVHEGALSASKTLPAYGDCPVP